MLKRKLGKTGEKLTVVGFGGIVVKGLEQPIANGIVAKAAEEYGLNYFDVAPSYGNSEQVLGPALEPYRNKVFLACKTTERSAEGARRELEQSLINLRTDHFDLYQLHSVKTMEDVDQITGPGGALETFVKARQEGKTRFIGFSAHGEEAALELMKRFAFDTILFPLNYVIWHQGHFGPRALAAAQAQGMGILALKALAKRKWDEGEDHGWSKRWYAPVDTPEEAKLALRFTLSLPVTAAVSPGHADLLWWMCEAAHEFAPLTPAEEALVKERSAGLAPLFPQM